MKKFKFKFDVLLRIKEEKEKKAKERYGFALQKKSALEIENNNLKKELINYENRYLKDKKSGDILNYNDLFIEDNYGKGIDLRIAENKKRINEIEEELVKLKEELVEAMKERKMFEKLKERKEKAYNKKVKKIVEKRIEEISILHYKNRER
ncbi:MAG TPA: flagellar export protein FliJ [Spirochaetota bacterium]|nr:flagellar export protein FliJ [Spirochaetota bacterium]HOL56316.1 flagellar export protein FliJ [Spirochaetota bacterium]HPP03339.1 flagellar export protein FliJ [Spirochaetota bacterium]